MVYPHSPNQLLLFNNSNKGLNYPTNRKRHLPVKEVKKLHSVADILQIMYGEGG